MRRTSARLLFSLSAAFAVHVAAVQGIRSEDAPSKPPAARGNPPAGPGRVTVDMRKSVVETPLKQLVAGAAADSASNDRSVPDPFPSTADNRSHDNPTVEPGKVRWHADFDQARAAANTSGKPVLLFQMIGRLDQRFT